MTTVTIYKTKENVYTGFTCFGHAEYVYKGKPDILCASISVLVINTINSLEELAGEDMTVAQNEDTGFIKCDFVNGLKENSLLLVDAMVFGLENLSKSYGKKYLKVKYEEV